MVSVNNSGPYQKLTLDMVTNRAWNEEFRRKCVEAIPFKLGELISEKQKRQGRSQSRNSYP